jgi:hypothetical protein
MRFAEKISYIVQIAPAISGVVLKYAKQILIKEVTDEVMRFLQDFRQSDELAQNDVNQIPCIAKLKLIE